MAAKSNPKTVALPPWLVELLEEASAVLGADKVADFKLQLRKVSR